MREWKDCEDGLEYEDLVKAHRAEKQGEKKSCQSRLNTVLHLIGGSIGRILGTAIVVFAVRVMVDKTVGSSQDRYGFFYPDVS